MAARYYQQNIAQYNPLSMEEMMFAPMQMRQRHDLMDQGISEIGTSLGQFDVLSQDTDFARQSVDPVQKELESLASELATRGYDHSKMSRLMKLKSQRERLFSPTGDIGLAQSRKQQVTQQAEQLRKQYEKNPEIANFYINQLMGAQGLMRDEQGNIINQGLPQLNNVRHYDAKEINDIFNTQLDNIKDTLIRDYGFKNIGGASSIQDIYKSGIDSGRSQQEVLEILTSQISPEILASAQQYGLVTTGDPDAGMEYLERAILGAATGRASLKRDTRYQVITNEDKKFMRDQKSNAPLWTMDFLEGIGVDPSQLPDLDTSVLENKVEIDQDPNAYLMDGPNGKQMYVDGNGNPVKKINAQGRDGLRPGIKLVDYNPNMASEKRSDLAAINPSFKNKTDKEIIQTIKDFKTKVESSKVKTVRPVGENLNGIQTRIIGSKNRTGLLSARQIKIDGGTTGTFNNALQQLGYSSVEDFYDKGAPSYVGYVPEMGAFAVQVNDGKNKNKTKTIYVEADQALQHTTGNTMMMASIARTGAVFQATGIPGNLKNNPNYVKYFVNDLSNGLQSSKIVYAPPGLNLKDLYNDKGELNPEYFEFDYNYVSTKESQVLESDPDLIKFFK